MKIEIWLTEGGKLEIETVEPPEGHLKDGVYGTLTGKTDQGEKIIAKNVLSGPLTGVQSLSTIEIIPDESWSTRGESVEAIADVLGFQCSRHPDHCNPDSDLDLIERTDFRAGGGNRANWSMAFEPFDDYATRVNSIQEYHNLVRTGNLRFELDGVYGGVGRISDFISERLEEITWLSSYIQGTIPSTPLLRLYEPESSGSEDNPSPVYVKARSVQSNIGSSCRKRHLLLRTGRELPLFLDRAYENFIDKEEDLNLKEVFGLSVDSLNTRRPIDPRFVNLCVAIEMLANQYSTDQGDTEKQIKLLVDGLEVEFKDLINVTGSFPTEHHPRLYQNHQNQLQEYRYSNTLTNTKAVENCLPAPQEKVLEYFWYPARNKVIHGNTNISVHNISTDYESLLVLVRRILREILLEGNTDGLRGLQEFEANELAWF
ncbi:hypothetical protein [Halosimplex pelagicum]|uniref:ApeA N-terminal domain-containing protein n=1 Tax=Halosimplex pelagicum TaxID=869886 RepID=A0A7D5PCL9_9EURY|nr:hypothetical protein [Halosimplex pelagicum]QLH84824.1 hypothetical protein HZS54_25760 [Halosimplex pelagicum]